MYYAKKGKKAEPKVFHLHTKTDYSMAHRLHSRLSVGDNETPSACHSFTEFYRVREECSNTPPKLVAPSFFHRA